MSGFDAYSDVRTEPDGRWTLTYHDAEQKVHVLGPLSPAALADIIPVLQLIAQQLGVPMEASKSTPIYQGFVDENTRLKTYAKHKRGCPFASHPRFWTGEQKCSCGLDSPT